MGRRTGHKAEEKPGLCICNCCQSPRAYEVLPHCNQRSKKHYFYPQRANSGTWGCRCQRKATSDCPGPIPIGGGTQREAVRLVWDKEDFRNQGFLGRSHQAHTTFWATEKSKCVNTNDINIISQPLICKAGI